MKRRWILLLIVVFVVVIVVGWILSSVYGASKQVDAMHSSSAEAVSALDDESPSNAVEEWPGQSQGYVGPNGEGQLNAEDFDKDEKYVNALIESGGKEVPVEKEPVFTAKTSGYFKGWLHVNFYRTCGEAKAREIVGETGGIWVSSTFAWPEPADIAFADVYYPESPSEDELNEIARRLTMMEEVESAYMCHFEESLADDAVLSGTVVPDDASVSMQYWLMNSKFYQAWALVQCSGAVEIAVFDSGVDLDHEDLAGNISIPMPYDAYHQTVLQGSDQDSSGHGTKVCGVASAVADNEKGIAGASFNAGLVPVRVCSTGGNVDWDAVERAYSFVMNLTNKPEVINMSFGGTYLSNNSDQSIVAQRSRVQSLINSARNDYGIVCVAAAGNNGATAEFYPAKFDGVIGVSALNSDATFASTYSNHNATVDLSAPGTDVYTTANPEYDGVSYRNASGTSFAAPQVAAVAALLKAQHSDWTAGQIESRLESTARDLGASGKDGYYGYGALDAAAAVGWSPSPHTGGDLSTAMLRAQRGALLDAWVGEAREVQSTGQGEAAEALEGAMAGNADVAAWLYVPGTNVSLPVAQRAGDDSYYLAHGADGNPGLSASYIENVNSPDFDDPVVAVYGHSFTGPDIAFTQLHRFGDPAFFEEHDAFFVYTPGRVLEYKIASAARFKDTRLMSWLERSDASLLQAYMDYVCSPAGTPANVRESVRADATVGQVVQLSTCALPDVEGERFVVTGVLVGERELE